MNKTLLFILVAALCTASCTKTILDVNNTNPNSASSSTPQLTTTLALENVARINQTAYLPLSEWLGYTATNGGFALDQQLSTYQLTSQSLNGSWQALYLNISNWNYVKKQALLIDKPFYVALSNLFQAYDFSCLVDLYNNVPYSDALLKNNNNRPIYDNGSIVYDSCVDLINEALVILKDTVTLRTISPSNDNTNVITFKGSLPDLTKWIRFANSLKLRLLINQSEVSSKASYIQAQLATIDPSMLLQVGDDVTADPGYIASAGKLSPFYGQFFSAPGQSQDAYKIYHASNYALDFYDGTGDPRISYFYQPDNNGNYGGNDFGDPSAGSASALGDASLDPTAPSLIMSAAEALFDQTEAIQRGWLPGNVKETYQNAVRASFMFTKVPNADTEAMAYVNQDNPDANWDLVSQNDKLQFIITQKWASLNVQGILRAYDDYRRTGFPDVPLSIYEGHLPRIPLRLIYPQNEYNLNSENVNAEGKIDPQTSKVFWDQ